MQSVSSQAAILKNYLKSDIAPMPMPSQVVAEVWLPAYFVSTGRMLSPKEYYFTASFSHQVFGRNETEGRID